MDFHPKNLPISKTYIVKNENDAIKAVEDMVNLGFKEKTDKKELLRDSEQADLTKVVGELDQTLFGSRAAPADTAGSGDPVQPQWTEKTKTAIKLNN